MDVRSSLLCHAAQAAGRIFIIPAAFGQYWPTYRAGRYSADNQEGHVAFLGLQEGGLVQHVGPGVAELTATGFRVAAELGRAVSAPTQSTAESEATPVAEDPHEATSPIGASLSSFVHDLDEFGFAQPDAAVALASRVLAGLDAAKTEALEVGDNNGDGERDGGDVDRTFDAVRQRVPELLSAGVALKQDGLGKELSRIACWDRLREHLLRIREIAADRTRGVQVTRYVQWCTALLHAFDAAANSFPPERPGTGYVERMERNIFLSEVHPRYTADWHDTPYGRAVAEVGDLRAFALPKLERLHKALEDAAQKARRIEQGHFFGTEEAQALSAAINDCLPLTARPSNPPPVRETPAAPAAEPRGLAAGSTPSSATRPGCEPGQQLPDRRHSPDFRFVSWDGQAYAFTAKQAACVRVLWEAFEGKTPDVGDEYLLETAESDTGRLVDLFRNHPAWGTMIVQGETKGSRRLAALPEA